MVPLYSMRSIEQSKDPIRLLRRRIIAIGLIVLIAVAVRGVWDVHQKERESRLMREDAERQLAMIKKREIDLRADIAMLKSDRGLEEVLREEYELAKQGEGVIVIVEPPTSPPVEEPPSTFEWFQRSLQWW